jgi:hypothetical protein
VVRSRPPALNTGTPSTTVRCTPPIVGARRRAVPGRHAAGDGWDGWVGGARGRAPGGWVSVVG